MLLWACDHQINSVPFELPVTPADRLFNDGVSENRDRRQRDRRWERKG